jgi:hypothetical protein
VGKSCLWTFQRSGFFHGPFAHKYCHRAKYVNLGSLFLGVAFLFSTITMGCAVRGSYRVYDPEYHDYHRWDNNEAVYYQRREVETHRRHEDFPSPRSRRAERILDLAPPSRRRRRPPEAIFGAPFFI